MARAVRAAAVELKSAQSNIGIHPTRVSMDAIVKSDGFEVDCGRVMPGVRPLSGRPKIRGNED